MDSNWIDKQVSLYTSHSDNTGRAATYRDILFTQFAKDLPAIIELRNLNRSAIDYKLKAKPFKSGLQCFTPAALMLTKEQGKATEISRSGLMQLDFDYEEIKDFDIEELKQAVFSLPFIAYCGLSSSGYGFYALALIAEPYKLKEYAEHCFDVFKSYEINPDESKGKKPENLRYISYDANMLIRENPEPLKLPKPKTTPKVKQAYTHTTTSNNNNAILNAELKKLQAAQRGNRWGAVQKVAYTLGGLSNANFLYEIKQVINNTPAFNGEEEKYCKCAEFCFDAGMKKPL